MPGCLEFANAEMLDLFRSQGLPGKARDLRVRSNETLYVWNTCD